MYQYFKYSEGPLMWTLEGQAKSVHNGELSTVVDTFCTVRTIDGP